jgi:hypothetical protein
MQILAVSLAAVSLAGSAFASQSDKRGFVYVPNPAFPSDDKIWSKAGSGLTWYYNYGSMPSDTYSSVPQSQLEFVPMMWGAANDETGFLNNVTKLISSGRKITHALAFNEPDGPYEWGGSNMAPGEAARYWIDNFLPLRKLGVKISLPVMMGAQPEPSAWILPFLGNCSRLLTEDNGGTPSNCTFDFVPVHAYGAFGDLLGKISIFTQTYVPYLCSYNSLWPALIC